MTELAALYRDHVQHLTEGYHGALEACGFDAVLVHAGRLELKSPFDDQEWPFRAVPAFEHWVDLDWPDSVVVIAQGQAPVLLARRSTSIWERPPAPDAALLAAGLEVAEVTSADAVKAHLPNGKVAFIGHDPSAAAELGIDEAHVNPGALIDAVHALRVKKTPYEVQSLYEASLRAAHGHRSVAAAFLAGVRSELDLHLTYLMATDQDDMQAPYKGIVALGDAAAVLHHIAYRDAPEANSLLVDAGARVRRYCADITRTTADVEAGGEAAAAFAELIQQMDRLQTEVVDAVAVGQPYEALHDLAHAKLGALLVESGLAKISAEACVDSGLTRVLFPHGLGHGLGVQVHDVGMKKSAPRDDNPYLRNTATVAEGQVFTIEPGLYFIDGLLEPARSGAHADSLDWDLVDALRPFGGIRVEDNVLVQAQGVRNLTREAFAEVAQEA